MQLRTKLRNHRPHHLGVSSDNQTSISHPGIQQNEHSNQHPYQGHTRDQEIRHTQNNQPDPEGKQKINLSHSWNTRTKNAYWR